MTYTEEDYNYINNCLDKCVKIEHNNIIYYVTSPNIIRQLKYNKLYNKKDIVIDLTKINYKDNVILEQNLKNKHFWINYYIIWTIFESKYGYNYIKNSNLINSILGNILNLNGYTTVSNNLTHFHLLGNILNLNGYTANTIKLS